MDMEITEKNNVLTIPTCGSIGKWRLVPWSQKTGNISNKIIYLQAVIKKMQDPLKGVPIKTVSTFMYKIPSVFSGKSLL